MVNKKIKVLIMILILLLFTLIFSGCTVNGKKNYKKKDVTQYLNTQFNKKEYHLSKQKGEQGWQMKLVNLDELTFKIYAVKESYQGSWAFVTTYYLYQDIEYLLALHYLEQYSIEYPDEYQRLVSVMTIAPEPVYYGKDATKDKNIFVRGAHLELNFAFSCRSEMVEMIDYLGSLIDYLDEQSYPSGIYIELLADMELDSSSDSSMKVFSNGMSFPSAYYADERYYLIYDRETLINQWDYRMAVAYARWRIGPQEYSIEEISELLENGSSSQYILTVERADGSIERWSDLLYSYWGVSINVLYEVLMREGIAIENGVGKVEGEVTNSHVMFSVGDTYVYLDDDSVTYVVDGVVVARVPFEEADEEFDLQLSEEGIEEVHCTYFLWEDANGDIHWIQEYDDEGYRFEYFMNGEEIDSGNTPVISVDLFESITGLRLH